jgi:hypothetical protein
MFKRVMTILICVLAVLFVVLLMDRMPDGTAGKPGVGLFVVPESDQRPTREKVIKIGSEGSLLDGDIRIYKYDKATGDRTHVIEAIMRPEKGTGRARLITPRISFFGSKGNEFRITAPHGWVDTEGLAINEIDDIKRGALTGGVVLRDDRGTPKYEADDLIILMDECYYDQKLHRFHTDSLVTVRSPEADITATGMHLDLRRDSEISQDRERGEGRPSRLKELRLLRKITVIMYEGGDQFELDLMPSGGTPASPKAARAPSGSSPGATDAQAARKSANANAGRTPFQFILNRNVRITRGDGKLEGADRVVLMTWLRDSMGKKAKSADGDGASPSSPGESPAELPRTPAAETRPAEKSVPINIVCDGPLVFAPMPLAEAPEDFKIRADGEHLVLEDQKARATGETFHFDGATGAGGLSSDTQISVALNNGRIEIVSRAMAFRRDARSVEFTGPGRLKAIVSGSGMALAQGDNREPFVATWQKRMAVTFDKYGQVDLDGKPVTDASGKPVLRDYLRRAEFEGRAVLRQGKPSMSAKRIDVTLFAPAPVRPTPPDGPDRRDKQEPRTRQAIERVKARGNVAVEQPADREGLAVGNMTCESLDVLFRKAAPGKSRPKKLTASGNVRAVHDRGFIECQSLDADFAADAKRPQRDRIVKIVTTGDVRIRQKQADGQVLYAEGRHMESVEHRAAEQGRLVSKTELLLVGTPAAEALALYGPHRITGQSIWFDERTNLAEVKGTGTLRLMSDRSMDGRQLKNSQPIHIAWADGMTIRPHKGSPGRRVARFHGKVRARASDSKLSSDDLWVFLEEVDKPDAVGATKDKDAGVLAGKMDVSRITAEGNVEASSVDVPKKIGAPATVTTITGGMLEYQTQTRAALVDGQGTMRIREVPRGQLVLRRERWQPTSTTTVTWKKKMVFHRQKQLAWFGEDVTVEVDGKPSSFSGSGGDFEGSGKTRLWCQVLMLYLREADKAAPAADGALSRGGIEVREVVATGGPHPPWVSKVSAVAFRDGDHYGKGERITFTRVAKNDPKGDYLELSGNPARIEQRRETEPLKSEARRFRYWPKTERFEILEPWTIEGQSGKGLNLRRDK